VLTLNPQLNKLIMQTNEKDIKDIKKFFNSYSKGFSSIYTEDDQSRSIFNKLIDKWFRKAVYRRYEITLSETQKDSINSVLDVGCGPGHHTIAFLHQGKEVTALDVADEMVDLTKEKVAKFNSNASCKYVVSDYMTHSFDEQFDAICVMGFFDYVSDPVTVLKKLLSEARKEIYISIPNERGLLGLQRRIRYWLKNCPLYSYSRDRLEGCLRDAGCLEYTDIIEDPRGFFVTIRKPS